MVDKFKALLMEVPQGGNEELLLGKIERECPEDLNDPRLHMSYCNEHQFAKEIVRVIDFYFLASPGRRKVKKLMPTPPTMPS
jgi:hypothetical protein